MEVRYIMTFLGVYHRNLSNDKYQFVEPPHIGTNCPKLSKSNPHRPPTTPPGRKSFDRFPALFLPRHRGARMIHACHTHTEIMLPSDRWVSSHHPSYREIIASFCSNSHIKFYEKYKIPINKCKLYICISNFKSYFSSNQVAISLMQYFFLHHNSIFTFLIMISRPMMPIRII